MYSEYKAIWRGTNAKALQCYSIIHHYLYLAGFNEGSVLLVPDPVDDIGNVEDEQLALAAVAGQDGDVQQVKEGESHKRKRDKCIMKFGVSIHWPEKIQCKQ